MSTKRCMLFQISKKSFVVISSALPVEHLSLEQIKEKYGKNGILELKQYSPWTDDTQLMLVLSRGLLRGSRT